MILVLLLVRFLFQSTLPLRGATRIPNLTLNALKFQSTLPLRGATLSDLDYDLPIVFQSTLPLRGATMLDLTHLSLFSDFNPRSPYGERQFLIQLVIRGELFQSTLPLRGATKKF